MEVKKKTADMAHSDAVDLIALSVLLVAEENDPTALNPDFLRQKKIVNESLQHDRESIVSTPKYSQVIFEQGIGIKSDSSRIIIEQKGSGLKAETSEVPKMAKRLVQEVSILYTAIGINVWGVTDTNGAASQNMSGMLLGSGKGVEFGEVSPEVRLQAKYVFPERTIYLETDDVVVTEDNKAPLEALLFHVDIHRDIEGGDESVRSQKISSILDSWSDDMSDYWSVVKTFHP